MKGYELLKEIAEGKIKEGTKFLDTYSEYIYKRNSFGDLELRRKDGNELVSPDYSYFAEKDNDFEIIQDETDEIEEIKLKESDKEHLTFVGLTFLDKINELIKKVNEINRKLEEK